MSEPTGSVQFLNLNATAQAITLGKAQIVAILALNTTGVTVFVQIFDLPASLITLGTTRPMLQIPLAATSGDAPLEFEPPWLFNNQMTVYATTNSEGDTGAADGVFLQAFLI